MDQTLLVDIHGEGPADVCVTDLLTPLIHKSDVLPALRPDDVPASPLHTGDKFVAAPTVLKSLYDGHCTVCHKTLLRFIDKKLILVLAPSADLAVFNTGPVEVLSLLSERKTFVDAELVGEDLLLFQIHLRLMQLTSVDVGDGVRDDMDVKMVFILVDADQTLISRKEFFAEFSSDLQTLLRGDLLVLVETDDVVCIHPPGVFLPEPLLLEECPVDIIVSDPGWFIGAGNVDIAVQDLPVLEDIFDHVPHRPM